MEFGVEGQVSYEWAKGRGGTGEDIVYSIAVDDIGNVYTTGGFEGTADFDPGVGVYNLTSTGYRDIFISKLDSNGNFIWAKQIGGATFDDTGTSIVLDDKRNIYTTGLYWGTMDFDPGMGVYNLTGGGGFISKLDSAGNFVWAKSLEGSAVALCIARDNNGNIYTTGSLKGTADFDPGIGIYNLTSIGSYHNTFISKLDSNGNFVWAKRLGGNSWALGHSIKVDNNGNIYTTGQFDGQGDFNPNVGIYNLTSTGGVGDWDIFISKLDINGDFVWAKSIGGLSFDVGYSIVLDIMGNFFITGCFESTIDCDPNIGTYNLTSAGSIDIFIAKFDVNGNIVWAKGMGGIGDDRGYSLALDSMDNIYTTGKFSGSGDFDPGMGIHNLTSTGNYSNTFISKLDSNGNFIWAKGTGGISDDVGNEIIVDNSGDIYITGMFQDTVDFDYPNAANLISKGSSDIYVAKYSKCKNTSSSIVEKACNSYACGGNVYTASGVYTCIIPNAVGCDSVITLDLTIDTIDVGVVQAGNVLTASALGASYQWLDCENGYAPLSGKTGQFFAAGGFGSYAVEVSMNGCVDTSDCFLAWATGIGEGVLGSGVEVYPNPNEGSFRVVISHSSIEKIAVKLTDMSGRLVYEGLLRFENQEAIIKTDLMQGFYILHLEDVETGTNVLRKVVVE